MPRFFRFVFAVISAALLAWAVPPASAGQFQSAIEYATGTEPVAVAISDFNGDGIRDLAVAGGNIW